MIIQIEKFICSVIFALMKNKIYFKYCWFSQVRGIIYLINTFYLITIYLIV